MRKLIFLLAFTLSAQNPVVRSPGMTIDVIPRANGANSVINSNILQNTSDGSIVPNKAVNIPVPSQPTFNAAGTTTCDFSLSNSCHPGTMNGNTTFVVSNTHGSGPYYLIWTQDATGSRVPTYPGSFNATVCLPSATPNVSTFITIVFNAIGATYDGITCTSNDPPTVIVGSERAPITTTTAGQGALTFDSGSHTTSYYSNNSANKHIMPRTAGSTDQLAYTDLTGAPTGLTQVLTVRDAAGTGTCTITVTVGMITASTC